MRHYSHAETMPATVYVLRSVDKTFFKVVHSMFLGERVRALSRQFDFNLEQSFCFHFKDKQHALIAERELLAVMRGWEVIFDGPFPGHTEYFIEPGYFVLIRALVLNPLEGVVAVESIVDSLRLEDYDPPIVTHDAPETHSGS